WVDMNAKMEAKDLVRNWNRVVDDYTASGVDHRGRRNIENAAKIGIAGGPLFRICEADACANVEGREGVKLLICSGCKTAVYCSKFYQKNAWKSHKSSCGSKTVKVQVLPSQLACFQ
ncbi:hypothetical protein DFH07DRAFT_713332, partial [Mycena maculata]